MEKANNNKDFMDNSISEDQIDLVPSKKTKFKTFSYNGNVISVFTHSDTQIKSNQIKETSAQLLVEEDKSVPEIVDINKQYKGEETNKIVLMIAKSLNWNIEEISYPYQPSISIMTENINSQKEEVIKKNIENEIIKRPKHHKLTKEQLLYIKLLFNNSKLSISEISWKYYICESTLRKIKHLTIEEIYQLPLRNFQNIETKRQDIIEQRIINFYNETSNTFTSKDVQKYLLENTSDFIPLNKLVSIMKNNLGLSYKRWPSRPNTVDLSKVKALRCLFSANFIRNLKHGTLVWNIDEWTFTRTTKVNYSWSYKSWNKEVNNSPFVGNMYMILAILSNGWWFWLTSNNTIDSWIFIHFITSLNNWIVSQKLFEYNEVIYIMDNCPSHKSKATISIFNRLHLKVIFLPVYSPNLAPIELWFCYIKQKLSSSSQSIKIKLGSIESQNKLLNVMKQLTKELIKKYFSKFYDELKTCLNYFK